MTCGQRFAFGKALLRAPPESKPASSGRSPDDVVAKRPPWWLCRHDVLGIIGQRCTSNSIAMTYSSNHIVLNMLVTTLSKLFCENYYIYLDDNHSCNKFKNLDVLFKYLGVNIQLVVLCEYS
jgi:hypothetical protein